VTYSPKAKLNKVSVRMAAGEGRARRTPAHRTARCGVEKNLFPATVAA